MLAGPFEPAKWGAKIDVMLNPQTPARNSIVPSAIWQWACARKAGLDQRVCAW